ncbi:MAG: TlpA disulfide reductase family protein [bacterium]|nr:TlpA disulfide reductase family protein [bacterium]
MRRMQIIFGIAMLLAAPRTLPAALAVGGQAPDFTEKAYDENGSTGGYFTLSADAAGKVVYLQFNIPTCSSCIQAVRRVEEEVYPFFRDDPRVRFVQIAYDSDPYSPDDITDMITKTGCTQTVLGDGDRSTYAAYDVQSLPYGYIIDQGGIVRFQRKVYESGFVPVEEIINVMRGLLGGDVSSPRACVRVIPGISIAAPGQRGHIDVHVPVVEEPFDAYAFLTLPSGDRLSMTLNGALRRGIVPLAADVRSHPSDTAYRLLQGDIPAGAEEGMYGVTAALTHPGTADPICRDDASVVVTRE